MADWFKFYEDFLDNPRFQYAIHQMSEVCPVTVLLLTEHCRHKSDTIHWTGDEVDLLGFSAKINISPAKINEAINLLVKIRYITLDGTKLTFLKWNDLQSEYCRKKTKKLAGNDSKNVRTVSGQYPDSIPLRGEERRGDKKEETAAPARQEPHFPEVNGSPSLKEVLSVCQMIGLAPWKGEDWFNEMQGCGWLDFAGREIRDWQAVIRRVKSKWEADGRPKGPPKAKGAPLPDSGNGHNMIP